MSLGSDANEVNDLMNHPGWKVLERSIREEHASGLKRLRRCLKEDSFRKHQGYLDGLDFILNLPDKIINRGEQ